MNSPKEITISEGPFGVPDAGRGSYNDEFMDIDGKLPSPIHDSESMRKRILVGKKGSGKSLYLRWHLRAAEKRGFIVLAEKRAFSTGLAAEIDLVAMRDAEILSKKLQNRFIDQPSYMMNFWSQLWERALYLSASSVLLFEGGGVLSSKRVEIVEKYKDLFLCDMKSKRTVSNFIEIMSSKFNGNRRSSIQWRKYIDHPDWGLLRDDLAQWCEDAPPLALYVDAVDDDFEDAPQVWLHCQGGLFKTAFETTYKDAHLANRLHLVIAIRDITLSGVQQSEHGTRYVTDPKIQHLNWDSTLIRTFLHKKIQKLPTLLSVRPLVDPEDDPFLYWLGFNEVENKDRMIVERVSDYIIRHTRMVPRDIVFMGNAIYNRMTKRIQEGRPMTDAPLRQAVAYVAKMVVNEALRLCVMELIMSSDYMSEIVLQEWKENEMGVLALEYITKMTRDKVNNFFKIIGKEVFNKRELQDALRRSGLATEAHITNEQFLFRFDNLLWRHGLLAIHVKEGERRRWRFHWRSVFESPTIDEGVEVYGLHSGLIDLFKIELSDLGPVF